MKTELEKEFQDLVKELAKELESEGLFSRDSQQANHGKTSGQEEDNLEDLIKLLSEEMQLSATVISLINLRTSLWENKDFQKAHKEFARQKASLRAKIIKIYMDAGFSRDEAIKFLLREMK